MELKLKRIAIVAHPSLDSLEVEKWLNENGMSTPLPSRREGLTIDQVQNSLLKNLNAVSIDKAQVEGELSQIKPSNVWQGLALDFLLGNIEQSSTWGWSASNTLQLLEMWTEIDDQTYFLFLYQSPQSVLGFSAQDGTYVSHDEKLNNWAVYYDEVLKFYNKHAERSCLVDHDVFLQLKENSDVKKKILDFCSLKEKMQGDKNILKETGRGASETNDYTQAVKGLASSDVALYIGEKILSKHPAQEVYEELIVNSLVFKADNEVIGVEQAWDSLGTELNKLLNVIKKKEIESQDIREDKEKYAHKCCKLEKENELLRQRLENIDSVTNNRGGVGKEGGNARDYNDIIEENTLLKIQIDLMQNIIENTSNGSLSNAGAHETQPLLYGAGDRIKRQLTYRLGAVVVEANKVSDYFLLPYKLKKEHNNYKKDMAKRGKEKLPPISAYADAHKADHVKQHLSYKLGVIIMNNGSSLYGMLKIPFLMYAEAKRFKEKKA